MPVANRSKACMLGLLILLVLTGLSPASAQSIWLDPNIDRAVWLEVEKADFTPEYASYFGHFIGRKFTFATSAWFLSARWRVSGNFILRAELPYVNVGVTDYTYSGLTLRQDGYSQNGFGNPLLGVEFRKSNSLLFAEFTVRIPTMPEDFPRKGGYDGVFMDYDRSWAFTDNQWTFTAAANMKYKTPAGLMFRLRAGPTFRTKGIYVEKEQLFAEYGAQAGYQYDRLTALAGLSGTTVINKSRYEFSRGTVHQLGFAASYAFGSFIPGLQFRLPLDSDLNDVVDFVVGISAGYKWP